MTMKTVTGGLSTAPLSNDIKHQPLSAWRSALYLTGLGALGVILHASLRVPMHLPGHHGLEWMALLAFAVITVPRRWAATGAGIAAMAVAYLPVWGWHEPFAPLLYLASAVLFDLLYTILPGRRLQRISLVIAGALAFAAAGCISFFAGPHGASLHSAWDVWFGMHLGFGLAGSLIGVQIGTWTRSRFNAQN